MSSCWQGQGLHGDCPSSGASCVQEWALLRGCSPVPSTCFLVQGTAGQGDAAGSGSPPGLGHQQGVHPAVTPCVTRGWCVQHPARHCYCSCWQSCHDCPDSPQHIPGHGAVDVRCWGASATPVPARCWTAALPLPREAVDRGKRDLGGWGLVGASCQCACLMPAHQPAQGLLQSAPSEPGAICRAGREPRPVPAGRGSTGRAGRLQAGPTAVPTLPGWRRTRKRRRRSDLGVELAETTALQALRGLPPLLELCHALAVVFPQPQPACRGPAWE